ncbi:uncharacterized protein LOC119606390 isoform X3 [Lucilia sericata]|nr:uncharacterized protein LOC119606390 isoform X3 [Lucilia sericata]
MSDEGFSGKRVLNKCLIDILKETAGGRAILEYRTKKLTIDQRDFLIKIIVEEVMCSQIIIRVPDFPLLVNEIVSIFPSEKEVQGYYFISRGCKGSPSGKLYFKYKNCRRKRGIFDSSVSSQDEAENTSEHIDEEIDESVATAFKTSLNRDSSDWADVCEKWKRTYKIRRRELQNLNNIDFLQSWPKLCHAKASDLINIDFDFLYSGKKLMLFSKWEEFKNKMFGYYEKHIVNEVSKQLVTKAKESENIDYQDFIITILLNSIFQSSARFKNNDGKKTKKVTISDSEESFVLQLPTLNDYKRRVEDIINKYYSAGLTVQPFLIVEGNGTDIKGFYIYFDKNLLKFDSFIQSLDVCFKIFQVLSLKYPIACEQSWLFIQKYFFEINTKFDSYSSNIFSVINYLNN